ncbi:hypothetical protein EJB05_55664, partial [Eragrostis curvula]
MAMASSGGCTITGIVVASSSAGSTAAAPGDAATTMDERRLKRRLSNRESARRTRARKQQQVNDLEAEAEALRRRNDGVAEAVRAAARCLAAVEAENAVLRARALELGARLAGLLQCLLPSADCGMASSITASPADMMYAYTYY